MERFRRYGIYVVPDGALFQTASRWLGWDSVAGKRRVQPMVEGLPEPAAQLTETPRKYGFHGTIKPPFALAEGVNAVDLGATIREFCASCAAVVIPALAVCRLGDFVAITPRDPAAALADLAADAVRVCDRFRAPLGAAELARRRAAGLNDRQEALLQRWGYPYVMDEFRFHMTLTGRTDSADTVRDALAGHFAPVLPAPFMVDSLALSGQDEDGMFHLVDRYTLTG